MDTIKHRKKIGFHSKQGWKKHSAIYTKNSLSIAGHQIMSIWEKNYMKRLANIATKKGGSILEIGYGMGISANFIEKSKKVKKHTIIEFHPDVIKKCKEKYNNEIKRKIILFKGFWENVTKKLLSKSFDGIFFDTYPLHEKQIHKNHFYFFKEANRLLKKGGILTYYSDEAIKFSEEHLKELKQAGFKNINFKVCKVNPPKNCIYWNKKNYYCSNY